MTFRDITRKKEDIVVDVSDLEAEAANDSCQRYANSPLESVESQTSTSMETTDSMETSSTSSVEESSIITVKGSLGMGVGASLADLVRSGCSSSTESMGTDVEALSVASVGGCSSL